ncbi:hypothetical protein MPDQ_005458 [Monascus purpureus]|uniref:GPI anchored cell wall protein n=1 Tax=Monascus purpureus TaxID=5098 RepID=A0A507R0E9_MONPU|nr:hypothetical protein MPDQ_005458 [Monascus purpureus]BDD57795.1 hypothetical protein MAP00_003131 [Monascus purpureus]
MKPITYIALGAALATSALAADTTTELSVFNAGETTIPLTAIAASIVNVQNDLTTLALDCKGGEPTAECELNDPVTITAGPSTFTLSAIYATKIQGINVKYTLVQDCDITGSTQKAVCTVSARAEASSDGVKTATSTSAVTTWSSEDIYYEPLAITAGVEKLNPTGSVGQTTTSAAGGAAPTSTDDAAARQTGLGGAAAVAIAAAVMGAL